MINTIFYLIIISIIILFLMVIRLFIKTKKEEFTLLNIFKFILNFGSIFVVFVMILAPEFNSLLWDLSLYAVFILMCIRPLHNLFPKVGFFRLMPLRKDLGIFSAVIVVGFGILHYIALGSGFLSTYFSLQYWSFTTNMFWAHMGELTGLILLLTSNMFSMKLLKKNWKRIQRLSYIYFFSGAWYVFVSFNKYFGIIAIVVVFELTCLAFVKKILVKNKINLLEDRLEKSLALSFIILLVFGSVLFTLLYVNNIKIDNLNADLQDLKVTNLNFENEIKDIQSINDGIKLKLDDVKNSNLQLDQQIAGIKNG